MSNDKKTLSPIPVHPLAKAWEQMAAGSSFSQEELLYLKSTNEQKQPKQAVPQHLIEGI